MTVSLGYGLIGCGAFGRFCATQYASLPGLALVAVADTNRSLAEQTARDFGVPALDVETLLSLPEVDLVHIATPPGTHLDLALSAIQAGKHVLCEKPLALDLASARKMIDAAQARGRILAVNLIMRYNPLAEAVHQILEEKLLGETLHGTFENLAQDETLGPDHWFWTPSASGGIFIEHAVHFFDLFEWWLGPGRVVAAQQGRRPDNKSIVEHVGSTSVHGSGTWVNQYHGFHQAGRMDRQEFRIVCERGDLLLREWVPTQLTVDGLMDEETLARIQELVPHSTTELVERYTDSTRMVRSRHKAYAVDGRWTVSGNTGMEKPALYGFVVRSLMSDQLASMVDPDHVRRVDETNGFRSLAMAISAQTLAQSPLPEVSP